MSEPFINISKINSKKSSDVFELLRNLPNEKPLGDVMSVINDMVYDDLDGGFIVA